MFASLVASGTMATVELYDRQDCPYSRKVRKKLDELGVDYEETIVPERHTDRNDLYDRTGQRGVPCLFDSSGGQEFIADSDEIIAHLEETYA
jgi:glutaredoxin